MKEIQQLYTITQKLRERYKKWDKKFTLDGRLVGDIGEVLAAEKYGLNLYRENTEIYDGEEKATKRKVQIKASFKGYFQFPNKKVPNYYLAVMIDDKGLLDEIFNGPGQFVMENYIKKNNIKPYKDSYYTLSKRILKDLNKVVPEHEKIKIVK